MRTTKLYVGSIPSTVTEAETAKYFKSIEPESVFKLVASFKSSDKAKNYGFLTIPSDAVSRILSMPHLCRGQKLVCEAHLGENTSDDPSQNDLKERRLFMRNLKRTLTEDDLEAFFGEFGELESVAIVRSHVSGKSRSFGYVTFRDRTVAATVLQTGQCDIDGVTVYLHKYSKEEPNVKKASKNAPMKDDHQEAGLDLLPTGERATAGQKQRSAKKSTPKDLGACSSNKQQDVRIAAPGGFWSVYNKQPQPECSSPVRTGASKRTTNSPVGRATVSVTNPEIAVKPLSMFLNGTSSVSRLVRELHHPETNLRFNVNLGDLGNDCSRTDH